MIDADEDPVPSNCCTYIRYEVVVRLQPPFIWLVVLEIALEQDHARGAQIREQRTVALVQLHRGTQSDQKVIAC